MGSRLLTLGEPLENHMKRKDLDSKMPLHDYRNALQGAVKWLGDRYLLAEPTPRLSSERTPYFTESRRWHPTVIVNALAKSRS
jgi:hypothetical protein